MANREPPADRPQLRQPFLQTRGGSIYPEPTDKNGPRQSISNYVKPKSTTPGPHPGGRASPESPSPPLPLGWDLSASSSSCSSLPPLPSPFPSSSSLTHSRAASNSHAVRRGSARVSKGRKTSRSVSPCSGRCSDVRRRGAPLGTTERRSTV